MIVPVATPVPVMIEPTCRLPAEIAVTFKVVLLLKEPVKEVCVKA
jgi:hypothetical protein